MELFILSCDKFCICNIQVSKRKNKKKTSKSSEEKNKSDIHLSHGHRKRHALMGSDDSERGSAQKRPLDVSLSTENSTEHISTTGTITLLSLTKQIVKPKLS